jgi:hypothetical protein
VRVVRLGARIRHLYALCMYSNSLPHIIRVDIYAGTGMRLNDLSPLWIILQYAIYTYIYPGLKRVSF